jgi:hypothetical protein
MGTTIWVASDGETSFDPWGYGHDASDEILLSSGWLPFPGLTGWVQFTPTQNLPVLTGFGVTLDAWALPASLPGCGSEPDPLCEPIGLWYFPNQHWNVGMETWSLTESDGAISDLISIGNFGPGGYAAISFNSSVPEPQSIALLCLGLGLFGMKRIGRPVKRR